MQSLKTYEVPATGQQQGTVIWLHGLGGSNRGFGSIVPMLRQPNVKQVFPAAPVRPVTICGGHALPAWYDVFTRAEPPWQVNESDVKQASRLVGGLIEQELAKGIKSQQIILGGFSQGAALASYVGLRYPARLGGVVTLSGYFLLPHLLKAERHSANLDTPMLLCHGTHDPIVPIGMGRDWYETLVKNGHSAEFASFSMEHSTCAAELEVVSQWLGARLGTSSSATASAPCEERAG